MRIQVRKQSHRAAGIFAVALMAALVFLSSCVVQKGTQALLKVPITKSLNANKATLSAGCVCQVAENDAKSTEGFSHAFTTDDQHLGSHLPLSSRRNSMTVFTPECSLPPQLPYYILYGQMKVFS